jgi:hypothetical protein
MKKYQYQIVRYAPDKVSGEFVNVGVIVYLPETKQLASKFIGRLTRISQFFGEVEGKCLINILRHFQKEIKINAKLESGFLTDLQYDSLEKITGAILPKDDSALYCTPMMYGLDLSIESALNYLYEKLVNKYNRENKQEYKDDTAVWRDLYKQHFDAKQITDSLKPHVVKTQHDSIMFDRVWKNGMWNCFQPISFAQKRIEAVKTKVYRWSGIITELASSNEKIHIFFLSNRSQCENSLDDFIQSTLLDRQNDSVKISIIDNNDAEKFATSFKDEIDLHKNNENLSLKLDSAIQLR